MKVYIIASAKMEELYVRDWINYHLSLGVDKIIINDNNNEDYPYKLKDVIKEYIDSGKVIVENYHKSHNEINIIYSLLYNKYKNEFDWCVKLDIDEYLEIPETNNDVKKFLTQDKFEKYDVIMLSWIMKRINGDLPDNYHTYYFPIPVLERCNKISSEDTQYFFKCIIRSLNNEIEMSHHIPLIDSKKMCLSNGMSIEEAINKNICQFNKTKATLFTDCYRSLKLIKYAHINHYRYLSLEELYYKQIKIYDKIKNEWIKEAYSENIKTSRDLYQIYLNQNANNM